MSRKRATASEGLMTSVAQEKARRIATDRTSPSASSTDDEQPLSEAADENVDGMYLDTVDRSALDFDFEQ
ncbi:hypothetical protein EV175_007421, partial [Coemansia sp. RSA 1933]